jgi:hypothetical protein
MTSTCGEHLFELLPPAACTHAAPDIRLIEPHMCMARGLKEHTP